MLAEEEFNDQLVALGPALLGYARSIVRDPFLAEDLVQETFARALARSDSFRGDSSLSAWLHRILHNTAVDHVRRDREDPLENIAERVEELWRDRDYTIDAATVVARAETASELKDALLRLPLIYRSAVVLHDLECLTAAEIARVQEIGLSAAKQRLRRGRMMLVTALASGPERAAANQGVPMDCWAARSSVEDYLNDELPLDERGQVERHLADCATCPPLLAGLVATVTGISRLRDPNTVLSPELIDRILAGAAGSEGPVVRNRVASDTP